jgi:hypothetical protein
MITAAKDRSEALIGRQTWRWTMLRLTNLRGLSDVALSNSYLYCTEYFVLATPPTLNFKSSNPFPIQQTTLSIKDEFLEPSKLA